MPQESPHNHSPNHSPNELPNQSPNHSPKRPHTPVMLGQCMDLLDVRAGRTYIDATAGAGGHLREIARRVGETGRVIGLDRDTISLETLREELASEGFQNVQLVHANFRDIKSVVQDLGIGTVNGGILADLGVSSMQLDNAERGFSFSREGPLDMRMDPTAPVTAEHLVNKLPEKELADIIYQYGEEKLSRQIAPAVAEGSANSRTSPADNTYWL